MGTSLNTGNNDDDDARVIDSLVEQHAAPPAPSQQPTARIKPDPKPAPLTRLVTGSQAMLPAWSPLLLLPADANRTSLQLWCASDTPTDYARISDDSGKLEAKSACALIYSGMLLTFPLTAPGGHTGPIWVSCPDAVGPVTVSFIAVTS